MRKKVIGYIIVFASALLTAGGNLMIQNAALKEKNAERKDSEEPEGE